MACELGEEALRVSDRRVSQQRLAGSDVVERGDGHAAPQQRWRERHHSPRPRTNASSLGRPDAGTISTVSSASSALALSCESSANHCGVVRSETRDKLTRLPGT